MTWQASHRCLASPSRKVPEWMLLRQSRPSAFFSFRPEELPVRVATVAVRSIGAAIVCPVCLGQGGQGVCCR